jgi:hypothetical protein
MTAPTQDQMAAARAGQGMPTAGAHTVGAPDGGPGLPGTGWSTEHGDIRVAHFVGLHALQAVALFLFIALRRRAWTGAARVRGVVAFAFSYAMLFVLLLWQALRGQSLIHPDGPTLAALACWAVLTFMLGSLAVLRPHSAHVHLL